ncbi:MAG: asparagine synthase (glutamine-hydrolyzing) [Propionibacteriales bacterium]|nr:asparagine synthase (glutamine-hydrolyzing) [Propionibacteriales bacterium]
MLARLRHRGPDGSSDQRVGRTWLGHTRLSIVDLEGGDQPLPDESEERWVVCNGEIYNHRALREVLPGPFRTESDSEVTLHVVDTWGPEGIARLRGMFAFCIADSGGGLVAARDALGVKPLYWARDGERMVFASELRSFEPGLRERVEEFPPGHYWTPERGLVRYVELAGGNVNEFATRDRAKEEIRGSLIAAVRARMMADVPVGVFLSGGLDSSLVAAIMVQGADDAGLAVHSFAAGVEDSPDLRAARTVADHLGLKHFERVYTEDEVLDVLPDVVRSMEAYEPSLVRSAVPNYLLAELAADHVKVVLTGEGADELYAGYDYLRDYDDAEDLQDELVRSVEGLHNLNLQRCDRVTMAHGLEARVPFLDLDVIAIAQRVPIGWRLPGPEGQEKRILREAFAGWLPEEILWRRKEQFGDGSGTAALTSRLAERLVPEPDWESAPVTGLPRPRTREELAYQRIFAGHLGGFRADRLLGRFATA